MQITANFVKFTMKEEVSVIDRYFQAREHATEEWQHRNLDIIQEFIIDGIGEITSKVWEIFLEVIITLGIDLPEVKFNSIDPGKGSCYPIFSKNDPRHLHRLANRRKKRIRTVEDCQIMYNLPSEVRERIERNKTTNIIIE